MIRNGVEYVIGIHIHHDLVVDALQQSEKKYAVETSLLTKKKPILHMLLRFWDNVRVQI